MSEAPTPYRMQPLYVRVPRETGLDLRVLDEIVEAAGWQRVGYYAPPGRDIGLQCEDSRLEPVTTAGLLSALAVEGIEARSETFGCLGYRISGEVR